MHDAHTLSHETASYQPAEPAALYRTAAQAGVPPVPSGARLTDLMTKFNDGAEGGEAEDEAVAPTAEAGPDAQPESPTQEVDTAAWRTDPALTAVKRPPAPTGAAPGVSFSVCIDGLRMVGDLTGHRNPIDSASLSPAVVRALGEFSTANGHAFRAVSGADSDRLIQGVKAVLNLKPAPKQRLALHYVAIEGLPCPAAR